MTTSQPQQPTAATLAYQLRRNIMGGTNVIVSDTRGTVHVISSATPSNARRSISSGAACRRAAKYGRDA